MKAKPERSKAQVVHLTHRFIEQLEPNGTRQTYHDNEVEMGLRVTGKGKKVFFWCRRVRGRVKFKSLGSYPTTDLENARSRARILSGQLEDLKFNKYAPGRPDPFAAETQEWTLGQLFDSYVEKGLKNTSRNFPRALANATVFFKYIKDWSGHKLSEITLEMCVDRHNKIGEESGRVSANRCMSLVKTMFNFADSQGKFLGRNPIKGLKFNHEESRERYLTDDEMRRLLDALTQEPSTDLVDYVGISLYTGARRSNVLGMRWSALSFDENTWIVGKSKSGKPYGIALSRPALAILQRRRREAEPDAVFVFPSRASASGHLQTLDASWRELRRRANLQDIRSPDLRRSLGTLLTTNGAPQAIVAKALGHSPQSQATYIYARAVDAAVRAAVNRAGQHISSLAPKKKGPKLLTA